MQVNTNNFFRWYTDNANNDTSINIPRLGISDNKRYLPVFVSGEIGGFYINADVPFTDTDAVANLSLLVVDGFGNTKATIGVVLTKVVLATGYRLYASFPIPNLSNGEYQFSILNTLTESVKLVSNFFRIIDSVTAALQTVTVSWSNSRDAFYYDWSQVGDFVCQLRLHCSLGNYAPEGTIDQTQAVSTGARRNNNFDIDLAYTLTTYYFDDGANLACIPLFTADNIVINSRNYINKTLYVPNIRVQSNVNLGEIQLYDQAFSQINKYGQLPQQVGGGSTSVSAAINTYVIFNNSDDYLDVFLGTTGLTNIQHMAPNSVFVVPITLLSSSAYIQLSFTDADPATTMAAILGVGNQNGFTRATSNATSGTPFGNVTYAQLLANNYIMIFGTVNPIRATAWRGLSSSLTCVTSGGVRTGDSVYTTLEQYYTDNNSATGTQKPNVSSDPNYIAPTADNVNCPVNPSSYQTITLGFSSSNRTVCSASRINYYMPAGTTSLIGASLYTNTSLTSPAHPGYYSDGESILQYNGGEITTITACGF